MFSMMDKEKKLILLKHYFLYPLYDGARQKSQIHSVITLFFVCCLWWSKRNSSFSYNIVLSMLSMMEQDKKLILLYNYFLYVDYVGATEKTSFFLSSLWWRKRKNWFSFNINFCMFSTIEEEKKFILLLHYFLYVLYDGQKKKFNLLQHYFLYVVYEGAREKTNSIITLFFVFCLRRSKGKRSFCYHVIFLCCLWWSNR